MEELQRKIYREMAPARKLDLMAQFFWDSRELILESLRARHTDWTEEQLQEEVRRRFVYARS